MFKIELTDAQQRAYVKFTRTPINDIKQFLENITQQQQLYIKCLAHLISKCAGNKRFHEYCAQNILDDYWLPILDFLQIKTQPLITNFNLLMGMQLYQNDELEKAAQAYHSFHAIKELYDQNVIKLNQAIHGKQVGEIDCAAMLQQACLGEEHGTPIYLLRASICFWCAQYYENVLKNENDAMLHYQLAIQFLWIAHITKNHCEAAIQNARFYYGRDRSKITSENPYEFFNLLRAIEANEIDKFVEFINRYLHNQTMAQIAKSNGIKAANIFLQKQLSEQLVTRLAQPSPVC